MASLRDVILTALVARLATISGWDAQLRGRENVAGAAVQAVVFQLSEDKDLATIDQYLASLQVGVLITAASEDADATIDAGNPFRYLDRQVVLAEKKIHDPDSWGPNPPFTDVAVNGHDVVDPDEENQVRALLRLTFKYRHHFQDPELGV